MENRMPSRNRIPTRSNGETRQTRRYALLPSMGPVALTSQSSLWKSVDSTSLQTRGISLLLLAGDSMHTQLVNMVLTSSKFSTQTVNDAQQSTTSLSLEAPDVVLLDWDSEGIDGFAVLRGLRANPETARVPVIVMTNRAVSPRWCRELASYRVKWVLEKPIVALALPKLIEQTVNAARNNTPQDCRFQRSALLVECGQTASGASFKSI
jgi:response regulator RpfG family c-di-GMP phosphodiesterase